MLIGAPVPGATEAGDSCLKVKGPLWDSKPLLARMSRWAEALVKASDVSFPFQAVRPCATQRQRLYLQSV